MARAWTPEMVEVLRTAVEVDGVPFSVAARRIGEGITRNAAIAKAKRLGFVQASGSAQFNARKARAKQSAKRFPTPKPSGNSFRLPPTGANKKPTAPPHPFTPKPDPVAAPKHLNLVDLEPHQCKWPYGSGPFTFCGHDKPPTDQIPYCLGHMLMAAGAGVVRREDSQETSPRETVSA